MSKFDVMDCAIMGRPKFVGSGPIASAPPAGNYPAGEMWWDNVTGKKYINRYTANDYITAYAALSTAPCLHQSNWKVSFWVKAPPGQTDARVYGEGIATDTNLLLAIGANLYLGEKLRVFLRNEANVVLFDANFPQTVFNNEWHFCTIERSLGCVVATVDGVSNTQYDTNAGTIATPTTSTIGAVIRTTVSSDFTGKIANFKKCDQAVIPLNQASGSVVYDDFGVQVGTVIAPGASWWAKDWFPI